MPLVVGGAPTAAASWRPPATRRGTTASARDVRAEALRRCPEVVFVRPITARTATGRGGCGGSSAPAPSSSRSGSTRATWSRRRRPPAEAERFQLAHPPTQSALHVVRRREPKVVPRSRPTSQAPRLMWCLPARRQRFWRRSTCASCRASGRRGSGGCATPARHDRRAGRAGGRAAARLLPGQVGEELRDRARGIDPRLVSGAVRGGLDVGRGDVRARPPRAGRAARPRCGRWPSSWPRRCDVSSWSPARSRPSCATPTSRSSPAHRAPPVGFDDADRIAALACSLLDRALDDRPDALRLIGVGVSGFERHVQLTLLDG